MAAPKRPPRPGGPQVRGRVGFAPEMGYEKLAGMTAEQWSTDEPVFVENVGGTGRPAAYSLAESRDGLTCPSDGTPPADQGRFPLRLPGLSQWRGRDRLAAGVGTHPAVHHRTPARRRRRLRIGAVPHGGGPRLQARGPLMVDRRQGMEFMNRTPGVRGSARHPRHVPRHRRWTRATWATSASATPARCSSSGLPLPGSCGAGGPSSSESRVPRPQARGRRARRPDPARDIEEMQMQDPAWVRARADLPLAHERIAPIDRRSSSWGGTATISRGSSASATSSSARAARTPSGCPRITRCTATSSLGRRGARQPRPDAGRAIDGAIAFLTGT